jgi:uncharacterized protein (TIGR02118 family)
VVKLVFLCRRRPDLTREDYAERVLTGHVPLALKHHSTLRHYVVNIAEGTPKGGPAFDSLPALYFDSLEDFRERLYDSPEGEAIIHRDVQGFMGGSDAYATTEHVHKDVGTRASLGARSPGVKWMLLLRRRRGISTEAFAEHWLTRHAPRLTRHLPTLRRYVTNVVQKRLSETGEDWDGIAELCFASSDEARGTPDGWKLVAEDTARFAETALAYPVAEYVQK